MHTAQHDQAGTRRQAGELVGAQVPELRGRHAGGSHGPLCSARAAVFRRRPGPRAFVLPPRSPAFAGVTTLCGWLTLRRMTLFPRTRSTTACASEVFGWAMYDFANSGYTTVVLTAVFNAYSVGVVAGGASWATLAWTLDASPRRASSRAAGPARASGLRSRPARQQEEAPARPDQRPRCAWRRHARRSPTRSAGSLWPGRWPGHRAVEHLRRVLRRITHRGLPARTRAARLDGPCLRLGLEPRLRGRHARAGPVASPTCCRPRRAACRPRRTCR